MTAADDARAILSRLEEMHAACEREGVRLLVLTPLDCDTTYHACVPADERQTRRAALEALAEAVKASCKRHGRAIVDARTVLPLSAEHFDDACHPSPRGYDKLASAVHAAIRARGW